MKQDILKKAEQIINEAQHDENFHSDNTDSLVGIGERSVDYSVYDITLDKDYYLIIDFVDFSFESFSIVNRKHKQIIEETEA